MKLILAQCPRCKSRFKVVAAKVAGKKLRCASCRQAFRVPASAATPSKTDGKRPPASDEVDILEDYDGEVELVEDSDETDFPVAEFEDLGGDSLREFSPPSRALPARVTSKPKRVEVETPLRQEEKPRNWKTVAIVAAVSVVGLAVIGGAVFLATQGGISLTRKVEAPTEFDPYTPEVGPFRCVGPRGWEWKGGGGSGGVPASVRFVKNNTVISICVSIKGSIKADAAKAQANTAKNPGALPDELAPVAFIHLEEANTVSEDFYDYKEDPPQVIDVPYGPSRRSNFQAREGLLKQKVRGVRATLLNIDALRVVCHCPEKDFETLLPAFEKVIKSVETQ